MLTRFTSVVTVATVVTVFTALPGVTAGAASVTSARLTSTPARSASQSAYRLPVAGPLTVLAGFDLGPDEYAAGHRGVDLSTPRRGEVLAAAAGVVTFAGTVVNRGVVVIAHPDGVTTEYEPIMPVVLAGTAVRVGQLIGRVQGAHRRCPRDHCLHWGARFDAHYVDPLTLLLSLGRVHLIP